MPLKSVILRPISLPSCLDIFSCPIAGAVSEGESFFNKNLRSPYRKTLELFSFTLNDPFPTFTSRTRLCRPEAIFLERIEEVIIDFIKGSWPVFFCLYAVHQIEILDWLAEKIARILP